MLSTILEEPLLNSLSSLNMLGKLRLSLLDLDPETSFEVPELRLCQLLLQPKLRDTVFDRCDVRDFGSKPESLRRHQVRFARWPSKIVSRPDHLYR